MSSGSEKRENDPTEVLIANLRRELSQSATALASLADELRLAGERIGELENALRDVFGLAQGLAEDDSWYAEQREAEETFERVRKALKEPR